MKGITVLLISKVETEETDPFGSPVYSERSEAIENVLVAPSSAQEILDSTELYGKKAVYTLGIPKGDTHDWEDQYVEFFGARWHVFGIPLKGIDSLIPLSWNTKVMVERYDG